MKDYLDIFFGKFKFYRKLRGGKWVKVQRVNAFSGAPVIQWLPYGWFLDPMDVPPILDSENYDSIWIR